MPVPRAVRGFSFSTPAWNSALAALTGILCLPILAAAQTSSATPEPAAPAIQSQSTTSSGEVLSPSAHPDAAPVEMPTAGQIENGATRPTSDQADPEPAVSSAKAVARAPATSPATPSPGLASKYDVTLIGQRNVGNGLDFYSLDREMALGRQLSQEVESSAKLVTDPVINEYVNRIGQNLVRNSDARVPFTIKVLDTEEVNAFALPGGFFYVNSGLILAADNEAELAGVMAHEIAHVAARHATKNMTRAQIWNLASVPLIFIGGPVAFAISEVAGLAIPMGFLKFSRDAEREADLLGLEYDYATGYDPQAFVEFFEKLDVEKKKPNLVAKAFASHPMNVERIQAAQQEIRKYLPDRPEYIVDTSEFESVKVRLTMLENARHRGGAKPDPRRPVLLKRMPASDSAGSTQDETKSPDPKDDGRPSLKRTPATSDLVNLN